MQFPEKPKDKKEVYLDHAATTYSDEKVKSAMEPFWDEQFGNPSGLYALGRTAKKAIDNARKTIADLIFTQPETIIFTSGGTESDNLAIFGTIKKNSYYGKHIITTKIEHPAIISSMKKLEQDGFEIQYLDNDKYGFVNPDDVKKAIRKDTVLVSIMYANNEIGTIEPIQEIGKIILQWKKKNYQIFPYFHTDACQAAGALELNVEKMHVDLMTINGSKIYGPKGVGVLYKRKNVEIEPIIFGGGHEFGYRSGTENVAGIVGMAKALELVQANKEKENERLNKLRNYFWEEIQKNIDKVKLNGPELDNGKRLPNNLNISILDIEGEALLLYLDEYGIICSTGSACSSTSLDPSHVLLACGLSSEYAHGSLRFSLGKRTTKKDIDYVMKYLPPIVNRLREMSPVVLT